MKTRIISALVAVVILFAAYWFWRSTGLLYICGIMGLLGIYEYTKLTLNKISFAKFDQIVFGVFSFVIYISFVYFRDHAISIFASLAILFLALLVVSAKKSIKLSRIALKQGLGVLGFLYVGILPALSTRIVLMESGDKWLLTLMAIVFAGDTLAYFCGRAFGRRPLLINVSPKKTIEGSIGGIIGSCAAGFICTYYLFPEISPYFIALLAIPTGLFAQLGDLFESLLKRVARVKDSGRIMPGHGGMLDRVDGIYFGAPIFYILVSYLTGQA